MRVDLTLNIETGDETDTLDTVNETLRELELAGIVNDWTWVQEANE